MNRTAAFGAIAATILAPGVYLARFGYRFGASDQDEWLPWLLARVEPELLRTDWFVGVQESAFNVRSGFVAALTPMAQALSVEVAVAVVFVGSWALLSWSVYDVSRTLSGNAAPAVVATVLALAVLPRWTLGGNALGSSMLVPSLTGWALALAGMALFLHRRPFAAGILVGIAAWVQFLAGLHVGAAIAAGALAAGLVDRSWFGPAARFAVTAVCIAAPVAVAVADSAAPAQVGTGEPDFLVLLTRFRAPHHYLPDAFPVTDIVRTAIVAAIGVVSLALAPRFRERPAGAFAAGVLALAGFAIASGWLAGEGDRVGSLVLLQPFQHSMLSLVASAALAAGAAWNHLGSTATILERRLLSLPGMAMAAVLAATLLTVYPLRRPTPGTLDAVADWAREGTSTDALFALPPAATGFAYRSQRAVFVSYKTVAFDEANLRAWYRRLRDVAPNAATVTGALPSDPRSGPGDLMARLDADWETLQTADLHALARRHGITHFVRSTALPGAEPGFSLLALKHGYRVYGWNGAHAPPAVSIPGESATDEGSRVP